MTWMQTYTGKKFSLIDPQPEDVCLEDIIRSLSNICRFNGHCLPFYSVAHHSLLVQSCCKDHRAGLAHDFPEAYYSDISSPLKRAFEQLCGNAWKKILKQIDRVVAETLGYTYPLPQEVKDADLLMLATEKRDLMVHVDFEWTAIKLPPPANFRISPKQNIYPYFRSEVLENFHNH